MIPKIVVLICGITYCTAEPPRQPSKHAKSSQSFVRHDVPLSYEYSAVHEYTTTKPRDYEAVTVASYANEPKSIQYAPVVRDEEVQNVLQLAAAHVAAQNKPNTETGNVKNIEPKAKKNYEYLARNPGYEREIYQVVNKYPAHNAVYRQYPNTPSNENVNTINYMNQFAFLQKEQEKRPKYQFISPTQQPTMNIYDFVPKQYITPSTEAYKAVQLIDYGVAVTPKPFVEAIKVQPQMFQFHPKTHRMLLNLARAYNVAHLPFKLNRNAKSDVKDIPSHTEAIIKKVARLNPEKKTHLYPVENKIFYP